jgi:hypothetical protein
MEKVWTSTKINFDSAAFKLGGIGIGSLIIYVVAFILPADLLKLYTRAGLDGHLLFDAGIPAYARTILAFLCLGLLYWWGFRIASGVTSRAAWVIVLGGIFFFSTVLLFMAPFDALDIYDNISHGRIVGVYEANPYRQLIANYPHDPFYKYPRWKNSPSAYGPIWERLAGLTAKLSGNGVVANVLSFKILPGIFYLGSVGTVLLILRRTMPEQTLAGVLLLGWNPVALYETWGNGHNDMAMVFWILVAAWWIIQKRHTLATLSLVMGALIKYIPLLLIPVVLLVAWYDLPTIRVRLAFLIKTAIASFLLITAAYYPFWNGLASFSIGRRMQMFTTSVPSVILNFLNPTLGFAKSTRLVSLGALAILTAFILGQAIHLIKQESARDFPGAAFNLLAFYLLVTCLWFQQWYSLWLIGLAPLLSERNRNLALLFGFWVLSKQLIFGPLIVPTMSAHPKMSIWLEPVLTIAILGIPWIYALRNLVNEKKILNTKDTKVTKEKINSL